MFRVDLSSPDDFDGWRGAARALAIAEVKPDKIAWMVKGEAQDLFDEGEPFPTAPATSSFSVTRAFVDLAETAILHRDPQRFSLLYSFLVALRNEPKLMDDEALPLRRRIEDMAKSVRRDIHKMRAFLRFREIQVEGGESFVAWYEPEHHIVRANASFFVRRFTNMRWSILTPELAIHWDGETLSESPGAARSDAPDGDPVEDVWRTYYASIFNPARLMVGAMLKEMPKKYWKNMPETALVPQLIANAQAREAGMVKAAREKIGGNSAAAWEALREEAESCTRCDLYKHATQTVFGEGPIDAPMMIVGEQPGDQEDLAGHPFVGPAGQVLDRALGDAGIDRTKTYVTNAVKHFKFEPRGKRRIHAKPNAGEIKACRWWIDQERAILKPKVTVLLGATAAQSLLGKAVTIGKMRGSAIELPDGGEAWVTVHPSYLLRIQDHGQAKEEYAKFVEDLRMAAQSVKISA
jgi:DNA polymerase